MTLKENCAFDTKVLNFEGKTPLDLVRRRINDKNPYETNLSDLMKLEPYFKDEMLAKQCDPRRNRKQRKVNTIDYQQVYALSSARY